METKLVQIASTNTVPYLEILLYHLPQDLQVLSGTGVNVKASTLEDRSNANHFYLEITKVKHRTGILISLLSLRN